MSALLPLLTVEYIPNYAICSLAQLFGDGVTIIHNKILIEHLCSKISILATCMLP
jgi:hypothetical protein